MGHCGVSTKIPGYEIVRMPLYFILSGLFFKDYGGMENLFIKKANKLLVPFLFFYLAGCACYYALKGMAPGLLVTSAGGILDVFNNRQFFNGPIWFLLCLFWCNFVFCYISLHLRSDVLRITVVCILGAIGYWLGSCGSFVPLFIDVAFTALPFFAFGYYLKRSSILYPNRYDKYNILFALALWGFSYLLCRTTNYHLSLHYNEITGWATYVISIVSVMSLLYVCKCVKRLPFVSYVGRYSIVVLCVHHLIYRPLNVILTKVGITPPVVNLCYSWNTHHISFVHPDIRPLATMVCCTKGFNNQKG